jgi:hypothetical protein
MSAVLFTPDVRNLKLAYLIDRMGMTPKELEVIRRTIFALYTSSENFFGDPLISESAQIHDTGIENGLIISLTIDQSNLLTKSKLVIFNFTKEIFNDPV